MSKRFPEKNFSAGAGSKPLPMLRFPSGILLLQAVDSAGDGAYFWSPVAHKMLGVRWGEAPRYGGWESLVRRDERYGMGRNQRTKADVSGVMPRRRAHPSFAFANEKFVTASITTELWDTGASTRIQAR